MIGSLIDIQRVRQYFNQAVRTRIVWDAVRADAGFVDQVRRGLFPLPTDHPTPALDPFPPLGEQPDPGLMGRRVAVLATGGSGALASMLGVVRALEERGITPVAYGVCSGSALFGIPLAAGLTATQVGDAVRSLRPRDYLDPGWRELLTMPARLGRGWAGLIKGDRLERAYHDLLGDVTLGELPTPCWLPVWNIERNELEYLGPDNHPELPAARAVRIAVSLPLAVEPAELDGRWWMDGGIVDILPAQPFIAEDRCDLAIVINGFYPPGLVADEEPHWRDVPFSILHIAAQTRTMQHLQLARRSLDSLRATTDVMLLEPVPYDRVQGAGLYGLFLDSREWPSFMRAGYDTAAAALNARAASLAS